MDKINVFNQIFTCYFFSNIHSVSSFLSTPSEVPIIHKSLRLRSFFFIFFSLFLRLDPLDWLFSCLLFLSSALSNRLSSPIVNFSYSCTFSLQNFYPIIKNYFYFFIDILFGEIHFLLVLETYPSLALCTGLNSLFKIFVQ